VLICKPFIAVRFQLVTYLLIRYKKAGTAFLYLGRILYPQGEHKNEGNREVLIDDGLDPFLPSCHPSYTPHLNRGR
jgi:hypothetical protein